MNTDELTEPNVVKLITIIVDYLEGNPESSSSLAQLRKHSYYQDLVNFGEITLRTLFVRLQEKSDHTTLLLLGDLLGNKCPPSENGHVEMFDMCATYLAYGIKHGYISQK